MTKQVFPFSRFKMTLDYADDLNDWALSLKESYEDNGDIEDLNEAISAFREAIAVAPSDHEKAVNYLHNLAIALRLRFASTGAKDDVNEAIQLHYQSLRLPVATSNPAVRAIILVDLGIAFMMRYSQCQESEDLSNAIRYTQEALDITSDDHPSRGRRQNNLAGMLRSRFELWPSKSDLNLIVELSKPLANAEAHEYANFAVALQTKFEFTGNLSDLDDAIEAFERVADTNAPLYQAAILNGLSDSLRTRFERVGSTDDLDQAIDAIDKAVAKTPRHDIHFSDYLINQGAAYSQRAMRTRSVKDNDQSIESLELAISIMPRSNPNRPSCMHNLTHSLVFRFEHTKSMKDLEYALSNQERALAALPDNHLHQGEMLDTLGSLLRSKFLMTKSDKDIENAIKTSQKAVSLTPSGNPKAGIRMSHLGLAFQHRFEAFASLDDLLQSVEYFAKAAADTASSPITRIRAAGSASRLLLTGDKQRAKTLLKDAVAILPIVSPRILMRKDQQYNISECAGITALAVSLSIECGEDPHEALSISELGRGMLANMQLEVRSDISRLAESHGTLAHELTNLRERIEEERPRTGKVEDRRVLYNEFNVLLEKIRSLPGFERYLLGPTKQELIELAKTGPIVVLNISRIRADAILVDKTRIWSIQLPITERDLIERSEAFLELLQLARSTRFYEDARGRLTGLLEWLWDGVVSHVLGALKLTQKCKNGWPRVWWISSGLFNLLPIHAAGYHDISPPNTAIDRAISSYIPTIKSLQYARSIAASQGDIKGQKLLFIGMPKTPGERDLRYVETELRELRELCPSPDDLCTIPNPTKSAVLSDLITGQIAHFACHGYPSFDDPSQSSLLLTDWQTEPLTVADLTHLKLESPRFAFLSACHTARATDMKLVDESITLSSAVHLAGYPSVVGTLWHVRDAYSPDVTKRVYAWMLDGEKYDRYFDTSRLAEGLHVAVHALRESTRQLEGFSRRVPNDPLIWASYIYVGA